MSRVLITGMTSPQTSRALNKKSLSFSGVVESVLKDAGHTVEMCEPDITWTKDNLDIYDAVVVGLAPLTSISANHAYGALSVIDLMYDSGKLALLIDAPRPAQISTSFRAVTSNPDNLTKTFYANRRGYQLMLSEGVSNRILGLINKLIDETSPWPTVLYPALPWKGSASVVDGLPSMAGISLTGINLDAHLLKPQNPMLREREDRWVADSLVTPWFKKTANMLNSNVVPMKEHKGVTDKDVEDSMSKSIGSLITSHRDGTWWSYRYIQSLNQLTPVVTDWQESSNIGDSWNILAPAIEHLSQADKDSLSRLQHKEYTASVPTKQQALADLQSALNISTKNRKVDA